MEHQSPNLVAQFIEDTPAPLATAQDPENCCNALKSFLSEWLANSEWREPRPTNLTKAWTRVKPVAGSHMALTSYV